MNEAPIASDSERRIRQYFDEHNIPQVLDELLKELASKLPHDPYACIASWAACKSSGIAQIDTKVALGARPPSAGSRPPSRPASASAHRLAFSTSLRKPRRWTILILGEEDDRAYFFNALLSFQPSVSTELDAHAQQVRDSLRPFFMGKQSYRLAAHNVPVGPDEPPTTVVFLDPGIHNLSAEKYFFAMSLADVMAICCNRQSSLVPNTIGGNHINEYIRDAQRCGIRGLLGWCPDSRCVSGVTSRLAYDANWPHAIVSAIPADEDAQLTAMLTSVASLPADFIRPTVERGLSSSARLSQPSAAEYDLECRFDSLEGISLRVGDIFAAHCCGQRLTTTLVSIDIVFETGTPTNVLDRDVDDAGGAVGVVLTLSISSDQMSSAINAIGAPNLTLLTIDSIADVVVSVARGQLLSVEAQANSSDEDDEIQL